MNQTMMDVAFKTIYLSVVRVESVEQLTLPMLWYQGRWYHGLGIKGIEDFSSAASKAELKWW